MSSAASAVRVRPMCVADLDRVLELAASLPEAPHWPLAAYRSAIDPANTPQRIALAAADLKDETPAGFLVARLLPPEAELETIVVAAHAQRHGLGRLLLAALRENLRAAQVTELILEVRASNRVALGFYGAHGFEETGRRPRYYADPEDDAVLMRVKLA